MIEHLMQQRISEKKQVVQSIEDKFQDILKPIALTPTVRQTYSYTRNRKDITTISNCLMQIYNILLASITA